MAGMTPLGVKPEPSAEDMAFQSLLSGASNPIDAIFAFREVVAQRDEARAALNALLREARRWVRADQLKRFNIQIDVTKAESISKGDSQCKKHAYWPGSPFWPL